MSKPMIVKVQLPLAGPAAPGSCLVYAMGRKNMQELMMPADVVEALGDDLKGYFEATWSHASGWTLGERVADQPW